MRSEFKTQMNGEEGKKVSASYAAVLASCGFEAAFPVYMAAMAIECATAESPSYFFRGNEFHSRLVMDILRYFGRSYLETLSTRLKAQLSELTDEEALNYEFMPLMFKPEALNGRTPEEAAVEALPKFLDLCELLLDTIISVPLPDSLKFLMQHAQQQFSAKWPESTYSAPTVLLMLRLVIPAMVSLDDTFPPSIKRTTIKAAQTIQCIANGSRMRESEAVSDWIKSREPNMKTFLSEASTTPLTLEEVASSTHKEDFLPEDMETIASFVSRRPPVLQQLKQASLDSQPSSSSSPASTPTDSTASSFISL
jgi:hypothetical protein